MSSSLKAYCLFLLLLIPLTLILLFLPPSYIGVFKTTRKGISDILVSRDRFGVPHLNSSDLKSCFYAIGHLHAQDRLWEMTFKKVLLSGRLSESFGEKSLDLDIIMRTMGLYRTSIENEKHLTSEERTMIQAYADGINDYAANLYFFPAEFYLTGLKFENWTISDSIAVMKLVEFSLTLEWQSEGLKQLLLSYFESDFVEEITGSGPHNQYYQTTILNDEELKQSGIYEKAPLRNKHKGKTFSNPKKTDSERNPYYNMVEKLFMDARGSNNWVIHGNHTKNGKPLLANDPHLDNSIPSIWYPVEFNYKENGKDRSLFGFTISGTPFVMIGKTNDVCWGITALLGDDSDLFQEVLNEEETHYYVDGNKYPLHMINETILINGKEPHVEKVLFTGHGPIINNVLEQMYNVKYNKEYYSFAWTGYLKRDAAAGTLLKLYRTTDAYQFKSTILDIGGLYLNVVFFDKLGNIAYAGIGLHKLKKEDEYSFFPANGSNSDDDWKGFVPYNESIFVINPPKGYIFSANNKIATENIKHRYSSNGRQTPRSLRLQQIFEEKIKQGHKFDFQDMKKMQTDLKDTYAEILIPNFLEICKKHMNILKNATEREIIKNYTNIMKNWDFRMNTDSFQAVIYNLWMFHFQRNLLSSIQNEVIHKKTVHFFGFEQYILKRVEGWAKNEATLNDTVCFSYISRNYKNHECASLILLSLITVHEKVSKGGYKKWGDLYNSFYPHRPFSNTPLASIFEKKVPAAGNGATLNVAYGSWHKDEFQSDCSANMRFISDLEKTYYIVDTGVSENLFSKHRDDMMVMKQRGEYIELEEVNEAMDKFHIVKV